MLDTTSIPTVRRSRWPLERRWTASSLPLHSMVDRKADPRLPAFDFTGAMRTLCMDIVARAPTFATLDLSRVLITFTPCRNRSKFGTHARVTPMRFQNGAQTKRRRNILYGVQRYFVDDREMLYLMSFSLPRFLDNTFEEKMSTVFHELFHISPAFDGDIRRLPGRCHAHSHSKAAYDKLMLELVRPYLADHPKPEVYEPFRFHTAELFHRYSRLTGTVVPQPKLVPLAW